MKRTIRLMLAALIAMSVVATPAPVGAVGLYAVEAAQADAARIYVEWVSTDDDRPAVRMAARMALYAEDADAAIIEFITSGIDDAILMAEQSLARQIDFTTRVLTTHFPEHYPRVNAAARQALNPGTYAQLDAFVTTGYAAALERDQRDSNDDNEQVAAVRQADRDYVIRLRDNDPGAQVRAWATRAVDAGSTDADVAEFLLHGWISAAGLDLQTFRLRVADNGRQWKVRSDQLVGEARAAEQAARETAGQAQIEARAAAARAWAVAGAQTGPARVAWADAEKVALRQAETWSRVSQEAGNASSSNWEAVAGSAQATRDQWLSAQQHAAEEAAAWTALYQEALKAETEMTKPPTRPSTPAVAS